MLKCQTHYISIDENIPGVGLGAFGDIIMEVDDLVLIPGGLT
jgi:hypothetical protein